MITNLINVRFAIFFAFITWNGLFAIRQMQGNLYFFYISILIVCDKKSDRKLNFRSLLFMFGLYVFFGLGFAF